MRQIVLLDQLEAAVHAFESSEESPENIAQLEALTVEVHKVANGLVLSLQEGAKAQLDEAQSSAILWTLFAIASGAIVSILNTRRLTHSFDEVGAAGRSLARGDLDVTLDHEGRGPVVGLANDLDMALKDIRTSLDATHVDWNEVVRGRANSERTSSAMLEPSPSGLMQTGPGGGERLFVNDAARRLLRTAHLTGSGVDIEGRSIAALLRGAGLSDDTLSDVRTLLWR